MGQRPQKGTTEYQVEKTKLVAELNDYLHKINNTRVYDLKIRYTTLLIDLFVANKWLLDDFPVFATNAKEKIEYLARKDSFYLAKQYHILFDKCLFTVCPLTNNKNPVGTFYTSEELTVM